MSLASILEHLDQLSKSLAQGNRGPSFENQAIDIKIQLEKIYERINTKRADIILRLTQDFEAQRNAYAQFLQQEEIKKLQELENNLKRSSVEKSEGHFRDKNQEIEAAIQGMTAALNNEQRFEASLNALSGSATPINVDTTKISSFPTTAIIQSKELRIRFAEENARNKRLEFFGSFEDQLIAYQEYINTFERKVLSLQLGYAFAFVSNTTITLIVDPIGASVASDWVLRITDNNAYNLKTYKLGSIPEFPIVLARRNPDRLYQQHFEKSPILGFIQLESDTTSWNSLTDFEIFSDSLNLTIPVNRVEVAEFYQ